MYNELLNDDHQFLEKFQPAFDIQQRLQENIYLIDLSYFTACLLCVYIAVILVVKYKIVPERLGDGEGGREAKDAEFVYNIDGCPICLGPLHVPVRIRCGHAYCATCLAKFLKYVRRSGKCECPLCKSPIKSAKLVQIDAFCIHPRDRVVVEKQLQKMIDKAKYVYNRRTIYLVNLSIAYLFVCVLFLYLIFATNILPI